MENLRGRFILKGTSGDITAENMQEKKLESRKNLWLHGEVEFEFGECFL